MYKLGATSELEPLLRCGCYRFSRVIMTGLSVPGRFAPMRNHVRLWHLADILYTTLDIRFWGKADMKIALRNVR